MFVLFCVKKKIIYFIIYVDDVKIVEKSVDFFVVNFYEEVMIKLLLN